MKISRVGSKRPRWNVKIQEMRGWGRQSMNEVAVRYYPDAPPAASPVPFASRPVSGLASLDLPPSHDCSQWHTGKSALAYRCGGSTGIGLYPSPVSRLTRLSPDGNLKAARTLAQARRTAKKSQTAFRTHAYRLTYQHFSNYSQHMENELNALEGKLAQLIQVSSKLRAENHQLRQELAHALSSNRQCSDKMGSAKMRLEKLLVMLPEGQS